MKMSTDLDWVRYSCGIAGENIANEFDALEAENIKLRNACRKFSEFVCDRGGRWREMQEILADALGDTGTDENGPTTMPFGAMPEFPTIRGA